MSSFDLAVGIDGTTMNAAAATVYGSLYPKVFTGSQHVAREGLEFDVSWDVLAPPTFVLEPPDDGAAIVAEHLSGARLRLLPEGVTTQHVVDLYVAELEDTTFQMHLSTMKMTVSGEGGSGTDDVTVTIYVHAESSAGVMSLKPVKAVGTTSNPVDDYFLNHVILPQAMEIASTVLSGVALPPLTFPGVSLTPPAMLVARDHVIALANLAGKPVPEPPFPSEWPSAPFFALMSDDAKLTIARVATSNINGKRLEKSGSVDIAIGDAGYSASAVLYDVRVSGGSAGGPDVRIDTPVTGNVNAGIEIGCTTFGINYDLLAAPNPSGTITLSIHGATVRATTTKLDTFVLLLKPTGNPVQWILSALTGPLLQVVTLAFSPLITKLLEGISFDVWVLPSIPIDVQGLHFVVTPVDVRLVTFGGMASIEGTARITDSPTGG